MGYKRNYNSLLPDDFMLSEEFETIIEQLENTKYHFYITGKAGSGKSTLLAYFRSITKKKYCCSCSYRCRCNPCQGTNYSLVFWLPSQGYSDKAH